MILALRKRISRFWHRFYMPIGLIFLFSCGTFYAGGFIWSNNLSIRIHDDLQVSQNYSPSKSFLSNFENYDISQLDESDRLTRTKESLSVLKSVLIELRQIEQVRSSKLRNISDLNTALKTMENQKKKLLSELEQLQHYVHQANIAKQEIKDRSDFFARGPLNLLPLEEELSPLNIHNDYQSLQCQMFSCFDYSKCSIYSPFKVFIYKHKEEDLISENGPESIFNTVVYEQLKANIHSTNDPTNACLYIVYIPRNFSKLKDESSLQTFLHSLPHWNGDGRNNLILSVDQRDLKSLNINFGKAIVAQTEFSFQSFNSAFDLVIPSLFSALNSSTNNEYFPQLLPVRRKHFLSYLGRVSRDKESIAETIVEALEKLTEYSSIVEHNEFMFDFNCDNKSQTSGDNQTKILLNSTFTILFPDQFKYISGINSSTLVSSEEFNLKLMKALKLGTIPVIVGGDLVRLPFEDAIDWSRAIFRFPVARVAEIYVVLKTFTDSDIFAMRSFGSHIYRSYYSSIEKMLSSTMSYFRSKRLQIPAMPVKDEATKHHYNTRKYSILEFNSTSITMRNKILAADEEMLGPLESPFGSQRYIRNYSIALTDSYRTWNDPYSSPLFNFPSLANDPFLPTSAKFVGSSYGFRPINDAKSVMGKEFSQALGGNHVREQFTIIMLTYNREEILLDLLSTLKDLPYLNKVIVVWNSPSPPSKAINWPDIGVDIVVVNAPKNSLNNRFLPFDEIKTDAILSLDDDSDFRHDEIVFAFRIWRENRDRMVGFPARRHSWTGHSWKYSASNTCEFSMVLTGGAFFHKYYSYLYSYVMPKEIRNKVDEYLNCEDIAMNFLIAHVTRQPPIKVTGKWTFNCRKCPKNLSGDGSHYTKRSNCLNYFSQVFGYMPLLYTQFRADSALYKTRLPQGEQKCFRNI